MALSYENLSRLITSPDLVSHLQNLILDEIEDFFGFQWHGPHFLAFLRYATKLCSRSNYTHDRFIDLLKSLDYSASDCILYGETKHYRFFLETILSFMPETREFFTIQKLLQLSDGTPNTKELAASFIGFLVETIGDLLNCGTDSSVRVTYQVNLLLKKLKSLLSFLGDTEPEQDNNILTKIEAVANEAGFFLHSFFFTSDLVTATKMDLALSALVERIEILQARIKDHYIAVSEELNFGTGSLQVTESPREVSSESRQFTESLQSISMADDIIVGYEDTTEQIASNLLGGPRFRQTISIVGMGGLGKTTLAKKLYNDSKVRNHFDMLSWCFVSQTYRKRALLIDILRSIIDLHIDKILEMEDEELAERLYLISRGQRYLVVMDDIWDIEAWDDLRRIFPDNHTGSRILFTTRLKNVALKISNVIIEPPLMSPGESWNLLEQKVFKEKSCPQELQAIGKEIARNCQGLPLAVVVIAGHLSRKEKKASLWQQVAETTSSYMSQKEDDILKLSYTYLPNYLKPCFLYLNAFQKNEEIRVRKLLLLWIAEGFIEEKEEHKSFEDVAEKYLMELIERNLVLVSKRRSDNGIKACMLHNLLLDICWKIAEEENFVFKHEFLVSKNRSRLERSHSSETLSILHKPEKIRILESANDLSKTEILTELRYLEMSSKLISSIGRLQNLEFLLAERTTHTLPRYILNLPKLRHLRVGGPAKFSKNCESSQINSLQTLSFVGIFDSKDEEILKCSPNLRSLNCAVLSNKCPDLNFLFQLESLKITFYGSFKGDCRVLNLPMNIKKLTLSKTGLPWEMMSLFGTLPKLEILKLEDEAFEGEIWNTKDDEFQNLKFLKLDNLDLEQWNSSCDHFPILERLVLRYCDNLETIPGEFGDILTLQKIEVHACCINVQNSAMQIREEQLEYGNEWFEVIITQEIIE